MGLQGVATAVATARPVPGGLPAPLGLGFEAGCHPGELHLVAEEPAPDAPVFVLPPPKVSVGVDPGPPQPLVLLLRLAARFWVAASRSSWCEAPPFIRSSRSALASGVSLKVLVTSPSWGTESSPSCRASVKSGSLAARAAAARRPFAAPAEEPESAPSHSAADPWPALRVLPALDHSGREQGHPRGRQPLGLAEQGDELAGRSARQRARDRTPHDVTQEPDRLLDIGTRRPPRRGAAHRLGVSLRPHENHREGV